MAKLNSQMPKVAKYGQSMITEIILQNQLMNSQNEVIIIIKENTKHSRKLIPVDCASTP